MGVFRYLKQPVICLANACWEKLLSQLRLTNPVDITVEKRCLSVCLCVLLCFSPLNPSHLGFPPSHSFWAFSARMCSLLMSILQRWKSWISSLVSFWTLYPYDLLHGCELKPFINAVHPIIHLWSRALASHLIGTLTSWIQNSFLSHPSSPQWMYHQIFCCEDK